MDARETTVAGDSLEDAARKGATALGVPREDVEAASLGTGSFRVRVVSRCAVVEIAVSSDALEAHAARIAPAAGRYPQLCAGDVLSALAAQGVTHGILAPEIDALVAEVLARGEERRDIVVARGAPPRDGAPAVVRRAWLRPTPGDPGRRRAIVREGELLLERTPPEPGVPGVTVRGALLAARAGADAPVRCGPDISAGADSTRFRAAVPVLGYLVLDGPGTPSVVPAVRISADGLAATLELRAPGADETPLTPAEIDAAIYAAGVRHGLSRPSVDAAFGALAAGAAAVGPVVVASATPPGPARVARLELAVELGLRPGRVSGAEGRIDFRERGFAPSVTAGQRIGTFHPPAPGRPGRSVEGRPIPAPPAPAAAFKLGVNVRSSEQPDRRVELLAGADGVISTDAAGVVSVLELLDLPGDVDFATGHVDAGGTVVVRGSVSAGFRVRARGDALIHGSVEGGSVEAGGAVVVGGGALGGAQAILRAGSLLSVRFAQNARMRCGGDVKILESDAHGDIECSGRLLAGEGRGSLRGGRYVAAKGLVAVELGSPLGAATDVVVGTDPELARELEGVERALQDERWRGVKLKRAHAGAGARVLAGGTAQREPSARRHVKSTRELAKTRDALERRRERLTAELFAGDPPTVDVRGRLHAGVSVRIRGAAFTSERGADSVRLRYDPVERCVCLEPL